MKLSYRKVFAYVFLVITTMALLANAALAQDVAAAKKFEMLGGKVTLKDGAITALSFRDSSKLGSDEWREICNLNSLVKLTAYGKAHGLNDNTVGMLAKLTHLESLSTDGAQLSDDGIAKIAAVKSLRSVSFFHLSFRKEGFTGSGFASWSEMPKLEQLTVAGMSMGDEGFAAIAKITTLKHLRTWHTYRTEKSNTHIANLPNLNTLKLGQRLPRGKGLAPCLTNASLATIAKIETLESLELGEARFSFAGLSQVSALPNLKKLKVVHSEVNYADIEKLKSAIPNVKVDFEPITQEQQQRLNSYLR